MRIIGASSVRARGHYDVERALGDRVESAASAGAPSRSRGAARAAPPFDCAWTRFVVALPASNRLFLRQHSSCCFLPLPYGLPTSLQTVGVSLFHSVAVDPVNPPSFMCPGTDLHAIVPRWTVLGGEVAVPCTRNPPAGLNRSSARSVAASAATASDTCARTSNPTGPRAPSARPAPACLSGCASCRRGTRRSRRRASGGLPGKMHTRLPSRSSLATIWNARS